MPSSGTSLVATVPALTILPLRRDQPDVTSKNSPGATPCDGFECRDAGIRVGDYRHCLDRAVAGRDGNDGTIGQLNGHLIFLGNEKGPRMAALGVKTVCLTTK
jgi:hypothetical protein